MRNLIAGLFAGVLAVAGITVAAQGFLPMRHKTPLSTDTACPSGVCINDVTCSSAVSTGWIHVESFAKATLGVKLTDGDNSVTAVQVDCETSSVASTTADAGYDVCAQVSLSAAGVSDIQCPHVWEIANADADHFQITVDNLNVKYLQCKFTCTGVPAAGDTIYAAVLMRSP